MPTSSVSPGVLDYEAAAAAEAKRLADKKKNDKRAAAKKGKAKAKAKSKAKGRVAAKPAKAVIAAVPKKAAVAGDHSNAMKVDLSDILKPALAKACQSREAFGCRGYSRGAAISAGKTQEVFEATRRYCRCLAVTYWDKYHT